jgi:hypothetical protein
MSATSGPNLAARRLKDTAQDRPVGLTMPPCLFFIDFQKEGYVHFPDIKRNAEVQELPYFCVLKNPRTHPNKKAGALVGIW